MGQYVRRPDGGLHKIDAGDVGDAIMRLSKLVGGGVLFIRNGADYEIVGPFPMKARGAATMWQNVHSFCDGWEAGREHAAA